MSENQNLGQQENSKQPIQAELQTPASTSFGGEGNVNSRFKRWLFVGTSKKSATSVNLRQLVERLVAVIFRPIKLDYEKPFHWGTLIFVLSIFLGLLILASPFMVKLITERSLSTGFKTYLLENRDWINTWNEYFSFLFEVLIAFAIGGIWFTDPIAEGLRDQLIKTQNAQDAALTEAIPQREKQLIDLGAEVISLQSELLLAGRNWPGFRKYLKKQWELYRKTRKLMRDLYPGIPKMYLRFLLLKFVINFPKGIYGLVAFFMFLALSILKMISIYVNSPWLK